MSTVQGPGRAKKRTDVRWLIAFGIVGMLFWVGIGGLVFWAYQSDHQAREALDGAGQAWLDVVTSPYEPEVLALKSVGCDFANVVAYPTSSESEPQQILTCQASLLGKAPECAQVARAYLSQTRPSEGSLTVQVQHRLSQVCLEVYGADGELIRSLSH